MPIAKVMGLPANKVIVNMKNVGMSLGPEILGRGQGRGKVRGHGWGLLQNGHDHLFQILFVAAAYEQTNVISRAPKLQ